MSDDSHVIFKFLKPNLKFSSTASVVLSCKAFGKCSKISNTFLYLFSSKMLVIRAGIEKMLVRIANRETLIRLLLQKQSDLGLHCLPRPFFPD